MKKYIFSLVCLCCTLLPALEGQGLTRNFLGVTICSFL